MRLSNRNGNVDECVFLVNGTVLYSRYMSVVSCELVKLALLIK